MTKKYLEREDRKKNAITIQMIELIRMKAHVSQGWKENPKWTCGISCRGKKKIHKIYMPICRNMFKLKDSI